MMAQHSQYEAVLSTGQQILTQANHRAISSLQSQLHLIKAKWNALQEKISKLFLLLCVNDSCLMITSH